MNNLYNITIKKVDGDDKSMSEYQNKVVLVVNIATKCGLAPQLEGLEKIYQEYKDQGLVVIGFPCNQFGKQSPEKNQKTVNFCQINHGVSFEIFAKIDVNGHNQSELYKYLKTQQPGVLGKAIKWNFAKFLIDRQGNVVKRFSPTTKPEKIESYIRELL